MRAGGAYGEIAATGLRYSVLKRDQFGTQVFFGGASRFGLGQQLGGVVQVLAKLAELIRRNGGTGAVVARIELAGDVEEIGKRFDDVSAELENQHQRNGRDKEQSSEKRKACGLRQRAKIEQRKTARTRTRAISKAKNDKKNAGIDSDQRPDALVDVALHCSPRDEREFRKFQCFKVLVATSQFRARGLCRWRTNEHKHRKWARYGYCSENKGTRNRILGHGLLEATRVGEGTGFSG